MAQVNIEGIIEQLSEELKNALKSSVKAELPDDQINERYLVKRFEEELKARFVGWSEVLDEYVRVG